VLIIRPGDAALSNVHKPPAALQRSDSAAKIDRKQREFERHLLLAIGIEFSLDRSGTRESALRTRAPPDLPFTRQGAPGLRGNAA
jgi:hypothetical protein